MTDAPKKGRSYEKQFEVQAPIEAVWEALTTGDGLTGWFCESAECSPGVGGFQTVDWGGGMVGTQDITVWDAPYHYRAEARAPEQAARGLEGVEGDPYATEWFLEHANGITKVRMVQSGFGEGPGWDGEYDGTYKGWDMFHANLRTYLEQYPGKKAAPVVLMAMAPEGADAAFAKVFGPEGFCATGSIDGLQAGDAFDITAVTGDRFTGRVKIADPSHKSFHGTVDSHDAVINMECACPGGMDMAFVWINLLCWGRPKEETDGLKERLGSMMATLFPTQMDPSAMSCSPEEASA